MRFVAYLIQEDAKRQLIKLTKKQKLPLFLLFLCAKKFKQKGTKNVDVGEFFPIEGFDPDLLVTYVKRIN